MARLAAENASEAIVIDLLAWFLWRTTHAAKLPGLEREARVLSEGPLPRDTAPTIHLPEPARFAPASRDP